MSLNVEDWTRRGFLVLIAIGLFSFIIISIANITSPSEDKYTFEVIGIEGDVNASSLASLHFECIKYCMNSGSYTQERICWEECEKLGKYVCEGDFDG